MRKILLLVSVSVLVCVSFNSCGGYDSDNSKSSSSMYVEDDNYWESIDKEQDLRDAGMDGAANIERNARREYMNGGGYTSPEGDKQIHYQGSQEQKRDLEMIDEYFNEHGWD